MQQDAPDLAEVLPGRWFVRATNFPMWLGGARREPVFEYGVVKTSPLVLSDDVSYAVADGRVKHIVGRDRVGGDGFVWRGRGVLKPIRSRWQVTGVSADGNLMAIRFSKSIATPAGIDILEREGVHNPELRAAVAADTARYRLTMEDFASLTWLPARAGDDTL